MSTIKKGLGRGLGSLFGDLDDEDVIEEVVLKTPTISQKPKAENVAIATTSPTIDKKEETHSGTLEVPTSLIDPNKEQPRKNFDEKALFELAQSIKSHGIIQPLVLVKRGERFMIVSGERRFRAAMSIGLSTVPAVIKDLSDREVREIAIIENLQREDLNPIESAKAIKELIEKYRLTQEEVADKIGKSRPAVANTLRLLTLPDEIISLVEQNRLSSGHARALIGIENYAVQLELAKLACDNKISVRELEKYIKKFEQSGSTSKAKKISEQSLELKDFTKKMQNIFATKVTILGNDKKGRIYIDYYNSDDLNRIYSLMEKVK